MFPALDGNPRCDPRTWGPTGYNSECCSAQAGQQCGLGQGDCDLDNECIGDLVCGRSNCEQGVDKFTVPGADCCQLNTGNAFTQRNASFSANYKKYILL